MSSPLFPSRFEILSSEGRINARLFIEKSKPVFAADDMPPEPESTRLNMRRAKFTIRMWQGGQEQSCRPGDLGSGVMPGVINGTDTFVLY